LSEEFLSICKNHLKPGGIIYYNTTGSDDVVFTATKVFKHVVRYDNFVAASDSPFVMSYEEKIKNLLKFENNGSPIFDKNDPDRNRLLHEIASFKLHDISDEISKRRDLLSITDDNMATEFKRINNKHKWLELYNPEKGWFKYLFSSQ
jgi:spermidine synthase